MKLPVISRKIKYMPVIVGLSSISLLTTQSNTSIEFTENEFLTSEIHFDNNTIRFFNDVSFKETSKLIIINSHLESLYRTWRNKTMFFSNAEQIIKDDSFKEIVSIGYDAIPFILEKIKSEPSVLVWALNMITQQSVSDGSKITVTEACKMWYKWGEIKNIV